MPQSFVTPTLNSCLLPILVTAWSMMLGFPSTLFTTACSNPDDFVNTSTDLFEAPSSGLESASPAPVKVAVRRNSLRLENSFMKSSSRMPLRMLAAGKTCKHSVRRPFQFSHSHFRQVIRSADPALQVFEVFVQVTIFSFSAAC